MSADFLSRVQMLANCASNVGNVLVEITPGFFILRTGHTGRAAVGHAIAFSELCQATDFPAFLTYHMRKLSQKAASAPLRSEPPAPAVATREELRRDRIEAYAATILAAMCAQKGLYNKMTAEGMARDALYVAQAFVEVCDKELAGERGAV
jgi:hypothetical protein